MLQLLTVAEASGVLTCDKTAIFKQLHAFRQAVSDLTVAQELTGAVIDAKWKSTCEALSQRAVLTTVEVDLLLLAKSEKDKDEMRPCVKMQSRSCERMAGKSGSSCMPHYTSLLLRWLQEKSSRSRQLKTYSGSAFTIPMKLLSCLL